ncbi:MAG: hypothetical protein WCP34_02045 [Pseudomonadota bacterium]
MEPYRALAVRVDALSRRERMTVMLAVVAVTYALSNFFLLDPMDAEHKVVRQQIEDIRQNITETNRQMLEMAALRSRDPDQSQRQRRLLLDQQTSDLRGQIQQLSQHLVSPRTMTGILRRLLTSYQGLELISLEDEPLQRIPLMPASNPKEAKADAKGIPEPLSLYRHTLVLSLRGDFITALRFLDAVEAIPDRLYWESLDYHVEKYPKAVIRVRLSTLSLREGWIGV